MSVWDGTESKKEQQEEGELVGSKKMRVERRGESESVWERGREREREMGWREGGQVSVSQGEKEKVNMQSRTEMVALRTRRRRSEWEMEKMRETDGHCLRDPVGLEPLTTVLTS